MKKLIIAFMIFCSVLSAQDNINVMSYYASDNSLDGQPRIDMTNILRFFPVYAILYDITEVYVNIYYGSKIYEGYADKMSGGDYWQILLPEFKLGEAIQRVEIDMEFNIERRYYHDLINFEYEISSTNKEIEKLKNETSVSNLNINKIASLIDSNFTGPTLLRIYNDFNKLLLPGLNITQKDSLDFIKNIILELGKFSQKPKKEIDTLSEKFYKIISNGEKNSSIKYLSHKLNSNTGNYFSKKQELDSLNTEREKVVDDIFENIVASFTDSSFSGPSIRKSDLVISKDYKTARLLYRYYKNNLRYRKALDPAESLGIFRARYVPLPVVGTPGDNKVQLLRPMEKHVPVVFEVGLAFGDEVVSGDNTFQPALSLSRLGVAIVITEKLFKADAEILGIAFTYDFNSYASIGVGRNLAQGQSYPYYSFGINKKAFEQLLVGLAGLFK